MSRIGQQPIAVPDGVTVAVEGGRVFAKGPLGELSTELPDGIQAGLSDGTLSVTRADDTRRNRSLHGLVRSLVFNMVEGVSKGFAKQLEIQGVGFRAAVEGSTLLLSLGFSGPKEFAIPEGVQVVVEGGTALTVSGPDKQAVGNAAARIRSYRPVEPYKGKGIRYRDEHVRRKAGKTVA